MSSTAFRFPRFSSRTLKRKKHNNIQGAYQQFETRNLLAGLIANGSFETDVNIQGLQFDVALPGWNALPNGEGRSLLDVVPTSQGNALKIDSQPGNFDRVFQNVATTPGERYLLSFDIANKDIITGRSGQVRVYWDRVQIGVFEGTAFNQTVAVELLGGAEDFTRLEFRETFTPDGGDGMGSTIGDVRIRTVNPLPFENGSFENGSSGNAGITRISDIDGWVTNGPRSQRTAEIRRYSNPADSERGNYYWNLDATNRFDRLTHEVATDPDAAYVVTFEARSPFQSSNNDNQIRVRWNGRHEATFAPTEQWQTYSVVLQGEEDGRSFLNFREASDGESEFGDGLGPWIDNVKLYEVDQTFSQLDFDFNGPLDGETFTTLFTGDTLDVNLVSNDATITAAGVEFLQSMSVRISNAFDSFNEILSVEVGGTSISASYDDSNNLLVLEGLDTVENYETVLRTIKYTNLSLDPDERDRIVEISAAPFEVDNVETFSLGPTSQNSGSSNSEMPSITIEIQIGSDSDQDGITDTAENDIFGTDPIVFGTLGG